MLYNIIAEDYTPLFVQPVIYSELQLKLGMDSSRVVTSLMGWGEASPPLLGVVTLLVGTG